jgi:hypothetical protein
MNRDVLIVGWCLGGRRYRDLSLRLKGRVLLYDGHLGYWVDDDGGRYQISCDDRKLVVRGV